ncbi:MAG: nuclear transport factor 2 family protein [Pseudohongiellaceae bacterium]
MNPGTRIALFFIIIWLPLSVHAQFEEQVAFWQEVEEADRNFSSAATTLGRTQAFLEVLAENSVVFRAGPVDAREVYTENQYLYRLDQVNWRSHYIDVSRAGDLGVSVGPNRFTSNSGDVLRESYGYIVGIWIKEDGQWKMFADVFVRLPGYLNLEVKPDFADTARLLQETAPPALVESNDLQTLIDADNVFGQSINFRGGQRAMIRFGLQNQRVYLPGMAPAVGVDAASAAYGKFMDSHVATTNPVTMRYMGGYLASSKELGVTYGVMATVTDEGTTGFQASYLRVWRFSNANEWRIALEVVSPF